MLYQLSYSRLYTIVYVKRTKPVGRAGFEPTKAEPTDLQSAPFDRFGISPETRRERFCKYEIFCRLCQLLLPHFTEPVDGFEPPTR